MTANSYWLLLRPNGAAGPTALLRSGSKLSLCTGKICPVLCSYWVPLGLGKLWGPPGGGKTGSSSQGLSHHPSHGAGQAGAARNLSDWFIGQSQWGLWSGSGTAEVLWGQGCKAQGWAKMGPGSMGRAGHWSGPLWLMNAFMAWVLSVDEWRSTVVGFVCGLSSVPAEHWMLWWHSSGGLQAEQHPSRANGLICSPLLILKQMGDMLANKSNEWDEKLAHMDTQRGMVWGIFSSLWKKVISYLFRQWDSVPLNTTSNTSVLIIWCSK